MREAIRWQDARIEPGETRRQCDFGLQPDGTPSPTIPPCENLADIRLTCAHPDDPSERNFCLEHLAEPLAAWARAGHDVRVTPLHTICDYTFHGKELVHG